jgi:hypothetical protein
MSKIFVEGGPVKIMGEHTAGNMCQQTGNTWLCVGNNGEQTGGIMDYSIPEEHKGLLELRNILVGNMGWRTGTP